MIVIIIGSGVSVNSKARFVQSDSSPVVSSAEYVRVEKVLLPVSAPDIFQLTLA